jgi:hypothetical protein
MMVTTTAAVMVTTTAAVRIRLGKMYAAPLRRPVGRSPNINVEQAAVAEDDGVPRGPLFVKDGYASASTHGVCISASHRSSYERACTHRSEQR